MWIMLTCKLPVSPAPPKLSIFWAQPWPGEIGTKMRRLAILDAFRAQKGESRPQREMFTVTCADCGRETQVPFQPRGDRPVYCRECLANHQAPRY